jgi:hypothetical protein
LKYGRAASQYKTQARIKVIVAQIEIVENVL